MNIRRAKAKAKMRQDEEAEMGVGTLIVFIAMILVAAVAATVLITTAFKMQQQAEHTGNIALADVATGFKVLNLAGSRDNPNDGWGDTYMLEIVMIKVGLLAGSPDINVSDVIIEITDGNIDVTLSAIDVGVGENYDSKASDKEFTVEPLRDMAPLNDSQVLSMMTPGDVGLFYMDANATGLRLTTQTTCHVKIIPKHGIPTLESFSTPAVYSGRFVSLV